VRPSQLSAAYASMYSHAPSDSVSHSPTHATDSLISLQQENARLQEEVMRLHRQLEWSFNALTETQKKLLAAESQLRAMYHKKQFKRSTSAQISPSAKISQSQMMKHSRSLDSIQHELVRLHLEQQMVTEMTEPVQLPMLNQKSPSLRAKTTKGHK